MMSMEQEFGDKSRAESKSSVADMSRVAEALSDLDTRRGKGDLTDFVQRGYSRALRQAIENNDWLLLVESLKSLGDLNLEIGKKAGDERNFYFAINLYLKALRHYRHSGVKETLDHRVSLARKCIKRPLTYYTPQDRLWYRAENEDSDTCMSRVAGILQDLDRQRQQGCGEDTLVEGYTDTMVKAMIYKDTMVELEALKSIGDVYLERGRAKNDSNDVSGASAVYKFALRNSRANSKPKKNETIKESLRHRIKYAKEVLRRVKTDMPSSTKSGVKQKEQTRSYPELHLAGDSALQNGDLDAAEEFFASALKQVYDRHSPRLQEEEECLRKLGDVYVRRGEQTKDGQDFAKATALYNAALARNGDKQLLIDSIKEAERLFLYHTVGIDCKPPPYETDIQHKDRLENYRTEVKSHLETIHKDHNPYQYEEDDPLVKEVEKKRAETVRDLFKEISEQRKDFIKDLVEECIETIGPQPCQYALVGLGSQATELVTPYSDLEFAILIEENKDNPENKEYFLNLTCYLYIKIINLRETILPAVAIKSLNDFHSEDPADSWFYDSVTPRGFAFDGAMPWASKTPFGREKTENKPAVSLIQTPAGMAELQQHDVALAHGYHLSSILRYVSYLTGDRTLVDDYMARVIQELWTLNKQSNSTVAVKFARESLSRTIKDCFRDRYKGITDKPLDVKREIYRFPAVAVMSLALLWNVYATSVWDVIQEMEDAGVVTKENAHHLLVLVGISGELRLRTYLELRGQKENLSGLMAMQKQDDEGEGTPFNPVFYVPDQKMLFRYHYTALFLKKYIHGITLGLPPDILIILGFRTFYDASSKIKAEVYTNLLQFEAAIPHAEEAIKEVEEGKDVDTLVLGPSLYLKALIQGNIAVDYYNIGNHKKAISYWEEQLKIWQQLCGDETKHDDIACTYGNLGGAWAGVGDTEKSLAYSEQALAIKKALLGKDAVHPDIAQGLNNIGSHWLNLGNHEKAISYLEGGIDMLKTIYGENAVQPGIAQSLHNLGKCWDKLGDHSKAIACKEQSIKMKKTIYGRDTAHPSISSSLTDLGTSLCSGLNDHVKALRCHEEASEMNKVIYGRDTPHPQTAGSLNNMGNELLHLGEHKKAIRCYEQALQMLKEIHREDGACHPVIALVLNNLGTVWCEIGDNEKALALCEQSLKMNQQLYGPTTPHHDTAVALRLMGVILEKSGEYIKAISFHEEALKMMEELFKSKDNPEIVSLLNNLGSACRNAGEYMKSLQYYERVLEINEAIHGGDVAQGDKVCHSDIALALFNLGVTWQIVGDNDKALVFCEQALSMNRKLYGPTTPNHNTAALLSCMGVLFENSEDNLKAIGFYEEALKMMENVYGNNKGHPSTIFVLGNLGLVCHKAGEHTKSILYCERALGMIEGLQGQDKVDPRIAGSLCALAAVYEDLEDYTKAIPLYEDALKIVKIFYGANEEHPDILKLVSNLATVRNKDLERTSSYKDQGRALKKDCSVTRCVIL